MSPTDPRHGTYAGGRIHRADDEPVCTPCRRAEARYEQERLLDALAGRPRRLHAIGTQRRLQALVALGHTFTRIAEALDMSPSGAHRLATRPRSYVRATTAAKVDALYEAWSMSLPPSNTSTERKAAAYARGIAQKHSWPPPLAWEGIDIDDPNAVPDPGGVDDDIDPVVVQRILAGDPTPAHAATPAERHLVVTAWETTGRPLRALIDLTGWKPERYRTPSSTHTTNTEENTAA